MGSALRRMVGAGLAVMVAAGGAVAQGESPFIRVVDEDEHTVRLDVAVRTLAPAEGAAAPLVNLVGAVHIADAGFYDDVQAFLDVHDLVLYEGVGGGVEPAPGPEGDEAAAALTERRLRFLSLIAEDHRRREGEYPASAEAIVAAAGEALAPLAAVAAVDAWGTPLIVRPGRRPDIVSLGADRRDGGSGPAADLRASDLLASPRALAEVGEAGGIQRDLAEALGLAFQLDRIDYTHAHWRNSDLSIGEIQRALGAPAPEGEDPAVHEDEIDPDAPESLKAADMLFRTLSGESFLAKISGVLLKMVGSSPSGRAMVKVMLADMLTHAEDLLAAQPGAMADVMKVIVEDRNAQVVRDLREVLEEEREIGSIAVFYGAGHFGDLERRIEEELGYRHESTMWIPAITIRLDEAGLSGSQVRFFRKMMQNMIEAQLEAVRSQR